jgi:hypothetical protein
MQEAKTYRQYAADCRRIATTMKDQDGKILVKMAEAWDGRADEAERQKAKQAERTDKHAETEK